MALVDDADYENVVAHSWHATQVRIHGRSYGVYADGRINGKRTNLHRWLLGATKGQIVDHIDGNPLNNQRSNLRLVTHAQNMRNRHRFASKTGFKGVRFRPAGTFQADIRVDNKTVHLGTFKTAELAARAYDDAARRLHGEFARTNAEST